MKKLLTTLCLLASAPLLASTVYTNESVDYRTKTGEMFRAYRSLSSCLNWYHMPGEYNELNSDIYYRSLTKIKVPKQDEPGKFVNANGYGFYVDLQLSPPVLQNADEEVLKQKIATFVNNVVARNRSDKKFAHYADCPTSVEAKNISLSRMMVRNKTDVTILESSLNSVKPNSVINVKKADSIDVLSDAYNSANISLLYDLSNPETALIFAQTFGGQQKVNVGQSRFMIYGKERIYDATITLKGEMSAQWVSELTTIDCKNSNSNSSMGLNGGVSLPSSDFVPNPSNPSASLSFNQRREVSVCMQKLLTRMANGKNGLHFEFEIDKNVNMENKFVTECENGECSQVKLDTWIRFKLMDMWVKNNFHVVNADISARVFEPVIRPTGETKALIDQKVSIGENFVLDVDLGSPIILNKIKREYPYVNSTSPRLNCLWNSYADQVFSFDLDPKRSLIPITRECFAIKE